MASARVAQRATWALVVAASLLAVLLVVRGLRSRQESFEDSAPLTVRTGQIYISAAAQPICEQTSERVLVSNAERPSVHRGPAHAFTIERERRSALGRQIFFDEGLSEPRGTSCASCHDPKHAFAGNHGSTLGTAQGSRPTRFTRRNTPSLLYLKYVRPFHFQREAGAPLPAAVGGFFWDGRSDSIVGSVRQTLLDPDEMDNRDARSIADKLQAAPYAADFAQAFHVTWSDDEGVLRALGEALQMFLTSDAMAPFSSKYDASLRGKPALSTLEKHGLELFRAADKGGCAGCHQLNNAASKPERSLFTDYGFEALGVPRNRKLPANRAAKRFDLGLCESDTRSFPMNRDQFCGAFRTPSLRNVAVRTSYMHNGAFDNLRDVVKFHVTRGQVPRLDDHEIDAVVAFLRTLTDAAYE
jgi:cytochrome c peroxidase